MDTEQIRSGKRALEVGWRVFIDVPRWKMKLIKWLWPDVMKFVKALYEYLVFDGDDNDYVAIMMVDWGIKPKKCRVCGCTDEDCSQCIEAQGYPCHWTESDLCSRCSDKIALVGSLGDAYYD